MSLVGHDDLGRPFIVGVNNTKNMSYTTKQLLFSKNREKKYYTISCYHCTCLCLCKWL